MSDDKYIELERAFVEQGRNFAKTLKAYEAATDRIAELEATVEEQRRTIEALVVPVEKAIGKEGSSAILIYIARIENQLRAVEANNARLREALAFIAEDTSEYSSDYRPPYSVAEEALQETPADSLAAVQREAINSSAKGIATGFYYHWHNSPGTNTADGFDDWWKVSAKLFLGGNDD